MREENNESGCNKNSGEVAEMIADMLAVGMVERDPTTGLHVAPERILEKDRAYWAPRLARQRRDRLARNAASKDRP